RLGPSALVLRSQPYYLDVTASGADKGHAVRAICEHAGIDVAAAAVIGDMTNDVAMFRVAGFSVAMGQGPESVRAQASVVTGPNTEDGFARAVERFILPRAT
ncbi:MAG: hydrolase, partial [Caulobacteraceae bacterium]|nr:hydrolase [Caulobacteraceae bacterium]